MTEWKRKRFWKEATAAETDNGTEVHLDGRALHTPGKVRLVLPTLALAQAIAAEWDAQEEEIDPRTMPMTRTANSAAETVTQNHAAVADMIADYGANDLLCYRAGDPRELTERQAASWDSLLDWARREFDAPLVLGQGVVPVDQPSSSLQNLRQAVHDLTPWQLAAFHDLVTLSGSLVIGLAASRDVATTADLWRASRIDEHWQAEQWGQDEEAAEIEKLKETAFFDAARFYRIAS